MSGTRAKPAGEMVPGGRARLLLVCPSCPGWPEWPVGMAYVLACLERHAIPFDFTDVSTTPNWEREVRRKLAGQDYLAVASGGLISFHRFFRRLAELTRENAPGTPFLLGGNIIKDANDELLFEFIGMDYGILGEAETSLPGFLDALRHGRTDFTGLDGVVFRRADGTVARTPPKRLNVSEYDAFPAWHHFDVDFYVRHSSFGFLGRNLRFMPILSGRGCIGKCGFCSPTIGGFRKRPIPQVLAEIRHLSGLYDFDKLCFLNEMFYPTAREIREFCEAYRQEARRKPWFVQLRVDSQPDVDTLRLMREAGCIAVSAGIESGSDEILARMNKKTTAEQIRSFFRNCKSAGMPACGTFIVGYDGETEDDLKKTVDLLIEEEINSGEALLFVYQGTDVYAKALARGLIPDERKHLDAISGNLFAPDALRKFCNLTAMNDEEFARVAPREVRRYNTFLFERFQVQNLAASIASGLRWTEVSLRGNCRECGADVGLDYKVFGRAYLGFLGVGLNRNVICPTCFSPLGFDIHRARGMEDLAGRPAEVSRELAGCQDIVLVGVNTNLEFVLRLDLHGLDYTKIRGVFPNGPASGCSYLNYPVVDMEELLALRPDCLLCLDDFARADPILRRFRATGLPEPRIVRLGSQTFLQRLEGQACAAYRIGKILTRLLGDAVWDLLRWARALP